MTTPTAITTIQAEKVSLKQMKTVLSALVADILLWAYTALVTYKIIYQRIILGLRYQEFSWSEPVYCLGIGAIIAVLLFMTTLSIGRAITGLMVKEEKSLLKKPFYILGLFMVALTFVAGLYISQVSMREFFSQAGLLGAQRIFTALLHPNFEIIDIAIFAAIETIYMAFIATALALPFAFLIGFIAARNLMDGSLIGKIVYNLTRFFLNISRSIEPLVWAIIFSVWVGIGPFAGMLALWLHSVSSLSKLYSEQIENISDGPIEAMKATGAHPIQVIWFGVVPQIILPYLSFTIYRWDINVRMATVIGLVGGGGIGTLLMQYQGLAKWNEVGLLAITIAAIVWFMDWASSKIRMSIK